MEEQVLNKYNQGSGLTTILSLQHDETAENKQTKINEYWCGGKVRRKRILVVAGHFISKQQQQKDEANTAKTIHS